MNNFSTYKSYVFGFILALLLTVSAYILVVMHEQSDHILLPHTVLIPILLGLAVVQLIVQLILFLHLGNEGKPYWKSLAFISTLGVVVILVFGSMWIIYHLNYSMMPDAVSHIMHEEGIQHD